MIWNYLIAQGINLNSKIFWKSWEVLPIRTFRLRSIVPHLLICSSCHPVRHEREVLSCWMPFVVPQWCDGAWQKGEHPVSSRKREKGHRKIGQWTSRMIRCDEKGPRDRLSFQGQTQDKMISSISSTATKTITIAPAMHIQKLAINLRWLCLEGEIPWWVSEDMFICHLGRFIMDK